METVFNSRSIMVIKNACFCFSNTIVMGETGDAIKLRNIQGVMICVIVPASVHSLPNTNLKMDGANRNRIKKGTKPMKNCFLYSCKINGLIGLFLFFQFTCFLKKNLPHGASY